jgi:signal transduction histidine kinase
MQQALRVNQTSLDKYQVEIARDFPMIPEIVVDKHQVLQVLVNLISNAKHAMTNVSDRPRVLTVRIMAFEVKDDKEWVKLEVSDTGVGISPENMTRVFSQGFTTKKDGHGFGLHSGSLSAKLMGGSLTVHSDGENQGTTFTLTLPAKRREVGVA